MKKYHFKEATPFIAFIEKYKSQIIGNTLNKLHTLYWPEPNWRTMSDETVILEIGNVCVSIDYFIPSDIEIRVGSKNLFEADKYYSEVMNLRNTFIDYFGEEFGRGIKKELIENRVIEAIEIERFSEAFEINPCTEEIRPDGGDYFSTIRVRLDSNVTLCFCGAESICDGYIYVWCE